MLHSLIQSISSLVSLFYLTSTLALVICKLTAEPGLTQGNYLIKPDLNTVRGWDCLNLKELNSASEQIGAPHIAQ